MTKLTNALYVFDITIHKGHTKCNNWDEFECFYEELLEILPKYCKKFTFQLEEGDETNRLHYQGRISFGTKTRTPHKEITEFGFDWSPTSDKNQDNDFYCIKSHTRVKGPWTDKDKKVFIPIQYRNIKLYHYQQTILDSADKFEPRICNVIYDPKGCSGKSTIAAIGELLHGGIDMPMSNDFKELLGATCNILRDTNNRNPRIMFFDMPRAIRKDQLYGLYSAIEQIKKGKVYDFRYQYKCWWFNSPQIWVFTNCPPNTSLLSLDRWAIWEINNNKELVKFSAMDKSICNNIEFNSLAHLAQKLESDDDGCDDYSMSQHPDFITN